MARDGAGRTIGLAVAGALLAWQFAAIFLFAIGYLPISEGGELPADRALVATLVTYLAALVAALLILRFHRLFGGGAVRLGLTPSHALAAGPRALLAFGFVMPWMFAAMIALSLARLLLGYDSTATHELLQELQQTADARLIGLILLMALVAAPLAEEVLFRGVLQSGLVRLFTRFTGSSAAVDPVTGTPSEVAVPGAAARWFGILIASALFAALHEAWSIPLIFLLAVMLGWLYERSGNLWLAILVHFAFNAVNTLMALAVAAR